VYTGGGNNGAAELATVYTECSFGALDVQRVIGESLEDTREEMEVLGFVVAVDKNVVHVSDNSLIIHVAEDAIHHTHECRGGVAEPKGEDKKLEVAVTSTESSFVLVVGVDEDVIEALAEIEFRKDLSMNEAFLHFFDVGEWSTVFNGN
jgi:hypothetical protein